MIILDLIFSGWLIFKLAEAIFACYVVVRFFAWLRKKLDKYL